MSKTSPTEVSSAPTSLSELEQKTDFIRRHIGPSDDNIKTMLSELGLRTLPELIQKAVPAGILDDSKLDLPEIRSEQEALRYLTSLANQNQLCKSFIGQGYAGTITPTVILRNILENPGWYTSYTPYQAEISQGRLEALLNFQTMIIDLTGMEIANASLLDEATAAAEAMSMSFNIQARKGRHRFGVAAECHPQTVDVIRTRAEPLGIEVVVTPFNEWTFDGTLFGLLLQYPTSSGAIIDYSDLVARAHEDGILVSVASDLLSLAVLRPPGEFGADIVVGNSQRFGVPLGYGGPHAGFFSTREKFKRNVPGRIVGLSQDVHGQPALRLALQTREQHIRREKATSNICTAQVLLAIMAAMYATYHGPEGIRTIARRVHRQACLLWEGLRRLGFEGRHSSFFDTVAVVTPGETNAKLLRRAEQKGFNLRPIDDATIGISLDETTTRSDVSALWEVFSGDPKLNFTVEELDGEISNHVPEHLRRSTPFLTHPVFNSYHSETEMLRYLNRLQEKDLSLTKSMIPLGSCTMKLNATTEMIPITLPGFSQIHPYAPVRQAPGYLLLIEELGAMLVEITGFAAVSFQPNAGSQGEYTGLLMIRRYHEGRGDKQRNICLIPSSAHGTNPASATMAGLKVIVVKCDDDGNIDVTDLEAKAAEHRDRLAALMITYPSTHGVFEESIVQICQIIHRHGGQVYLDGANLNALVGICRPGKIGADVAHLNLHKTFCIPHGGGGPGVGPVVAAEHLKPFLPSHSVVSEAGPETGISAVSAAPFGSAAILPISWAYIAMMGNEGLRKATQVAILNANYIASRLSPHYKVLYQGINGMVAHECIIDARSFKALGIEVDDIAKRLMDYGFHAPTMSWPVPGTLMIEPTESESKEELDRFCEAMISIREEIRAVEEGRVNGQDSPLKHSPHTLEALVKDWEHPYSREQAVYPLTWVRDHKFWTAVGRIDNVYGDRHFVCACPPMEEYE